MKLEEIDARLAKLARAIDTLLDKAERVRAEFAKTAEASKSVELEAVFEELRPIEAEQKKLLDERRVTEELENR